MPVDHRERRFEDAIEHSLLTAGGYAKGDPVLFDRERALDPSILIPFIKSTQPKQWAPIEKYYGADAPKSVLDDLCKALGSDGALTVIRHGFKCFGKLLRVAFFKPAHGMNPLAEKNYEANVLTATRQLHYSTKNENSLDLVLSLNGLPIVTVELKNPLSGQTVEDAKAQYKNDRDPNELIFAFKKRTLVHFAVDPDLVFMATRLEGKSTYFLPFNRGNKGGAGNPDNGDNYRSAYLWEEVWQRDSLLDILARFLHLQVEEKRVATKQGIKKLRKETMIFPRYHQLDAVRRLVADARQSGAGKNYLVEHSAGSGKSNTIAWLAHRLSSLHTEKDEKIFDSIIVITDRVVLDRQLQDTIYQFDHTQGAVIKVDKDTTQLAEALIGKTPVIITTLQKFPFITDAIDKLNKERKDDKLALDVSGRRFAVIVDEAHSSQSGETATELKGVLNRDGIEAAAREQAEAEGMEDFEEELLRQMAKRGKQENISFFAFTATPKFKTFKVFDALGPDGKPPFHHYSMRQAIEEGFILDVLANYTTYKAYYGLIKNIEDDPVLEKKKAAKALARFLKLHPHSLAQKTEIMIEHFRAHTRHKIGGRAKAMVVTDSRASAVRYKLSFDKYLASKGYGDIKTLVAFSGSVEDSDFPGKSFTEPGMNQGIKETELPEKFGGEEYQVLIVAEKYQTGFDQPLLHTMYVDKRLSGVQAVQTLSRLNRTAPGKSDTFVLDFVNERDEIYDSFKPYYTYTPVADTPEPRQMYDLHTKLDGYHVYFKEEIEAFCQVYFAPKFRETEKDHARLYAILNLAVDRFKLLQEEDREEFKGLLVSFRNLYAFLSQIIPYQDSDLEKLYTYARFLLTRLPRRTGSKGYHFEDEVGLKYYRLQKIGEGSINLAVGEAEELYGPTEVGTGTSREEHVRLSELVGILNERFGTTFTPADQLFFDQIHAEAIANEQLQQAAKANTKDDFKYVFDKALEGLLIERMEGNEDIFVRLMNDDEFRSIAGGYLLDKVYREIRTGKMSTV